ncbi:MAG: hypothetical protein LC115_02170 [Bacteroidia bacterium]|nr:hypothetical protein [Bacteroidia bacterium]
MKDSEEKEKKNKREDIVPYGKEADVLKKLKETSVNESLSREEYQEALKDITIHFDRLLKDAKLLTSVGDRLQRKLKSTNALLKEQAEEIKRFNEELKTKNIELQLTIDELTRSRAGRKATTIIMLLAIGLFMLTEFMETTFEDWVAQFGDVKVWSIAFKVSLVVLLKPVESYLEHFLLKRAQKKEKKKFSLD